MYVYKYILDRYFEALKRLGGRKRADWNDKEGGGG
jgi:hypothetical protein